MPTLYFVPRFLLSTRHSYQKYSYTMTFRTNIYYSRRLHSSDYL